MRRVCSKAETLACSRWHLLEQQHLSIAAVHERAYYVCEAVFSGRSRRLKFVASLSTTTISSCHYQHRSSFYKTCSTLSSCMFSNKHDEI